MNNCFDRILSLRGFFINMKISFFIVFVLFGSIKGFPQKFEELAMTPPMGWNSWNKFHCDVNEQVIRDAADAMVSSGMKDAGYEYIVIDDCWQIDRDDQGFIVADPQKFPSGMKALADYIHSKGLKFGLYSCAGRQTCQNRPGSRGHEFQDAITYAGFGVDFLKLDWCHSEGQNPVESYTLMRDALSAAGRPVVFSLCEWGLNKPWEWAANVGHLWRTSGDILNNWNIPDAKKGKCWAGGVVINLDMQEGLEEYAGPGGWNDPDMLQVGNGALTDSENRSHFALWCMLSAPLFAGNDLANMTKSTRDLLTNAELIAINQDVLGKQGFKIKDYGELEVFYKPLQNNEMAICIFNRFNHPVTVEMDWNTFQVNAISERKVMQLSMNIDRNEIYLDSVYSIRDVFEKKDIGTTTQILKREIPSHDVIVYRLKRN
ncbi:glycoside hydrolase family 27 protein [Aquiflexum sp.]|uniref:glycoside hydrolase family 27 protein n=1 Tax=Aquiflexum sp. TaxID=1872584 RepID=UPI0035941DC4